VSADFERPSTLSRVVIDKLREEIFRGELPTGQLLREAGLSARYGVSRNTVREALRQISNDGLAVIYPHRGASVRVLDAKTVEEAYSLRLLLEPHAVRLGFKAGAYDPQRLAALDGAIARMKLLYDRQDVYEQTTADYEFHWVLCSACRHSLLLHALQAPQWITRLCMIAAKSLAPDLAGDAERHRPLVEAIRQGPRQATRALCGHLEETKERILSRMSPRQ
jgi:DNA-binding GntR family transcriptional regulator